MKNILETNIILLLKIIMAPLSMIVVVLLLKRVKLEKKEATMRLRLL